MKNLRSSSQGQKKTFDDEQVVEMLRLAGLSYYKLAEQTGVTHTTVRSVLRNIPGHFCGKETREKIIAALREASKEVLPKAKQVSENLLLLADRLSK